MSLKVFRLTSDRYLQPCPLDGVGERSDNQQHCWVDIQQDRTRQDRTGSLAEQLASLGLHPLAVDACLEKFPVPHLVSHGKSLVMGLPMHLTWDSEEHSFLIIACVPGMLVTIHQEEIPALTDVLERYVDGMRFHGDTASAILYQILDHIIDQDMAFTLRTRDSIDDLEDLLESDFHKLSAQTLPIKRQLARLAASFEDQLYCIASLQTIDSESFNMQGLRGHFRDAVSHLEHASRSIGRQLTHLNAIQQEYQLKLQNKANDRLRLLTVISTIFIPLTLITGIYGMNFVNMRELQWHYGYFGVLGAMLTIAAAMLLGFFRAGWFR